MTAATVDRPHPELPARIADGKLTTLDGPYRNLLVLPLCTKGPVVLEFELEPERSSGCGASQWKSASSARPRFLKMWRDRFSSDFPQLLVEGLVFAPGKRWQSYVWLLE